MEEDLSNLVRWLEERELRVSSYVPDKRINHPVLKETEIIDGIISALKKGDMNAIELGCELVIENKRIPFGKILKVKILSSLKSQVRFVSPAYKESLSNLAIELLSIDYPPREVKELCKLIKKFEPNYTDNILNKVTSDTNEAKRWLQYLQN